MAKKQNINYGPDLGLIGGAKAVSESETMIDAAGASFAKGLTGAILTGIKEQEERNSIRDAYLTDLGGIENINTLEEDYNKQAVMSFVRKKRDEYTKLADAFSRTNDINILDKMDAIKFSFSNLNTQLQSLANERKEYLNAYDKGQLVDLKGDEKYTEMYTNRSKFNVEANGDIGFTTNGIYEKFKDSAGKWNVKNNIAETGILSENLKVRKLGESNKTFYRDDQKNFYSTLFESTGTDGMMVMAKTDLTGDNEYVLKADDGQGNPVLSGNQSFESLWSQGLLSEKFYQTFSKNTDSSWMYDKKNIGTLKSLLVEYYTDVTESMYEDAKKNYKPPPSNVNQRDTIRVNYGANYITRTEADTFFKDMANKAEEILSPNGKTYKLIGGVYHLTNAINPQTQELIPPYPVQNDVILKNAGIWNEGYRLDNFTNTDQTKNAFDILSEAYDEVENKSATGMPILGEEQGMYSDVYVQKLKEQQRLEAERKIKETERR
mgnify:CR=1 FL=1